MLVVVIESLNSTYVVVRESHGGEHEKEIGAHKRGEGGGNVVRNDARKG